MAMAAEKYHAWDSKKSLGFATALEKRVQNPARKGDH